MMALPVDGAAAAPTDVGRPRIVVAGLSPVGTCGVRDHAARLTDALHECGAQVTTVWLDHGDEPFTLVRLASMLRRACRQVEADVVLLHYSVFAYSWRGIPVSVPALALALHRLGVPVVLFAHEFAYPWGQRGWRGAILSLTQRVAFAPLVAASAGIIVTTEGRATWVRGRRWLPRRQLASAPVFSNISARVPDEAARAVPGRVGVFGFGAEGLLTEVVVEAVAQVHRSWPDVHLRLIGAPGPDGPAGRRLRKLADRVGCPVSFSGLLSEEQLSHELSSCDVIFHTDPAGPTSRKTTLAAALSHGRPVAAFDGPQGWQGLVDAGAVELVPADVRVTAALQELLQDAPRKAALSERAREFAAARLSPERTARIVLEKIDQVVDRAGVGDGRPRVALVAHEIHDHGGMERACAEWIRHAHDHYAFTVVSAELDPALRPLVDRWVRIRVPNRPMPLKFSTFFVLAGIAVRSLKVDLVHTVGAIVPNRVDVTSVQHCHAGQLAATGGLAPTSAPLLRRTNTTIARALALLAERYCYRPSRVASLAVPSHGIESEVRSYYAGIPTVITPNGADAPASEPGAGHRRRIRDGNGVRAGELVLLFLGGDWDRKRLDLVVEATARARVGGADVILWVVGSGDAGRFQSMASDLGISSAVRFFGRTETVGEFYQAADIFVLPSIYESFSIPCFEAARAGLPLVVSRIHGAGELVGEDEAGLIVERDAEDIARAITKLSGDAELRARLGAEGRRRASAMTWSASADSVMEHYRRMLAERSTP